MINYKWAYLYKSVIVDNRHLFTIEQMLLY